MAGKMLDASSSLAHGVESPVLTPEYGRNVKSIMTWINVFEIVD